MKSDYSECDKLYPRHLGLEVYGTVILWFVILVAVVYLLYWADEEIKYRRLVNRWKDTPKNRKKYGYPPKENL